VSAKKKLVITLGSTMAVLALVLCAIPLFSASTSLAGMAGGWNRQDKDRIDTHASGDRYTEYRWVRRNNAGVAIEYKWCWHSFTATPDCHNSFDA
jgi:hypothetical protein